jgi:colanic acid biosynthesis glycosyl transferase WcaI
LKVSIHDYGGYAFTLQLAKALAAHRHQVSYLYSETTQLVRRLDPAGGNGRLAIHGISIQRPFRKYSFLQRRAAEHEHGRKVVEMILKDQPDVVISANAPLDAQAKLLAASRKIGARFVFWFQDAVGLATRRLLRGKLPVLGEGIGLYYQALERRLARLSDHIILISEDFLPLMDAWGVNRCKVTTIPNWAPLEEIPPMPKDNPWAREHGLVEQFVFLYAGILGLKHNPGRLVELAQAVDGQARVVVVSEGGGAEWLADQATRLSLNNLLLLPFQPKENLPQMFGAADVLVSILSNEAGKFSVPSKVLSYLCAQRSLLLSLPVDNQAARLICQSQAGLVASPDDREAWATYAKRLIQNKALRQRMGNKGRAYAEAHFDIQKIAGQFLNVLLA